MNILIAGIVVFLSHTVEGITGFGCMILALPFLSILFDLKIAVPVLVILSTLFDIALIIGEYKQIKWKILSKMAVIIAIFMPIGFFILKNCPEEWLMRILGVLITTIALSGLKKSFVPKQKSTSTTQNKWIALLPLAGLVQGAFGGSGPFVVAYAQTKLKNKTEFRTTMAMLWVVLNLINLVQYGVGGLLTVSVLKISAILIPFIALGFLLGVFLHKKVCQEKFDILIYFILLITGISMFF